MEKGTVRLDLKERPDSRLLAKTLSLTSPLCKMETLPLARLTCNMTCGLLHKVKGDSVAGMWGKKPQRSIKYLVRRGLLAFISLHFFSTESTNATH